MGLGAVVTSASIRARRLAGQVLAALMVVLPVGSVSADARLSADAQRLLRWVQQSSDNAGAPFIIIDKRRAHAWVFDALAQPLRSSAVLLGYARGDDSVEGIGERPLREVRPFERTTPAGRFVLEPGTNLNGEDILWVDYAAAVSMHRVRTGNAQERRLQRLASPTASDNRISFGCINLPADFYDRVVSPLFTLQRGLVYVLPESRTLARQFPQLAAR
jgi:hypothetical protein